MGRLALIALAAGLVAGPALAQSGALDEPIPVQMRRGTDTIRMTGTLSQDHDCCTYLIKARAGQILRWTFKGPAARMTIGYPNGEADGPGLPPSIPLPFTGAYLFTVHPNLMADGGFGPFELILTIPPPGK